MRTRERLKISFSSKADHLLTPFKNDYNVYLVKLSEKTLKNSENYLHSSKYTQISSHNLFATGEID